MAVLPDVLEPGLATVFCGSAVGAASARAGAYYAGPGNKFWPTLHETGITDRLLEPDEYGLAPGYGFGFTDMNKTESGADSDLNATADGPDEVLAKIRRYAPAILAFTAKRPAIVFMRAAFGRRDIAYGLQDEAVGGTRIFVLPSSSGLGRRYWDVSWWQRLADAHDRARGA